MLPFLFFFTDVTVKLPPDIKSAKDLKVNINTGDISILRKNGDVILKDSLTYKIKAIDSFWSVSEGKLIMHLGNLQNKRLCSVSLSRYINVGMD